MKYPTSSTTSSGNRSASEVGGAPQGPGGHLVGARGPPEAQVDPPRVQRLEGAELLGDRPAGAWLGSMTPPDPTRSSRSRRRQVGDQHRRSRAGHRRHAVVLGHPEPVVAQLRRTAWADRLGEGRAGDEPGHRRQVQHGERYHACATPTTARHLPACRERPGASNSHVGRSGRTIPGSRAILGGRRPARRWQSTPGSRASPPPSTPTGAAGGDLAGRPTCWASGAPPAGPGPDGRRGRPARSRRRCVLAEVPGRRGPPGTSLVYGHLDKQPPQGEWRRGPRALRAGPRGRPPLRPGHGRRRLRRLRRPHRPRAVAPTARPTPRGGAHRGERGERQPGPGRPPRRPRARSAGPTW